MGVPGRSTRVEPSGAPMGESSGRPEHAYRPRKGLSELSTQVAARDVHRCAWVRGRPGRLFGPGGEPRGHARVASVRVVCPQGACLRGVEFLQFSYGAARFAPVRPGFLHQFYSQLRPSWGNLRHVRVCRKVPVLWDFLDVHSGWPGAGSNRRPSDFQSDARTN